MHGDVRTRPKSRRQHQYHPATAAERDRVCAFICYWCHIGSWRLSMMSASHHNREVPLLLWWPLTFLCGIC